MIAFEFPNRSAAELKNRFYSTLRRAARKQRNAEQIPSGDLKGQALLNFVDTALQFGFNCYSKRGKKVRKEGKRNAEEEKDWDGKRQLRPLEQRMKKLHAAEQHKNVEQLIEMNRQALKEVSERVQGEGSEEVLRVEGLEDLVAIQVNLSSLLEQTSRELVALETE